MKKIDARGLSCPEPVILTKKALASGDSQYEITVDTTAARENITRFASHQGFRVSCTENGDDYILTLTK